MADAIISRDPRRFFSASERAALAIGSGGLCQSCGTQLDIFHADHVMPHANGGATDVANGQALCPPCNLKKGASVPVAGGLVTLRPWQEAALRELDAAGENFLVVATPGAGKTTFALAAIERALKGMNDGRVVVVVPTRHLKAQWANAAVRFGIRLDHMFANGSAIIAGDVDGAAITYQQVASSPALWRHLTAQRPTIVVLDEIHHAGESEHLTWGLALRDAFEPAARRILLSGTPFRTDGHPIPFVEYDGGGSCVPGYNYDYGRALMDGGVVRPIEFVALDGDVQWRNAGSVESATLSGVGEKELAKALATALAPNQNWIPSVLERADQELSRIRSEVPDAGGLVIASDQTAARAYAAHLKHITGEMPVVAVSDDPNSSKLIERFSKSNARWIVAVRMVSEGVDIPRLSVGVYATTYKTELFVRQVVGRFVRLRDPGDEGSSSLYIPSIEPLLSIAKRIEQDVEAALREAVDRERTERERQESLLFEDAEPLSSSEAVDHSTIRSGVDYDAEELAFARKIRQGITGVSDAQVADMLRRAGLNRDAPQSARPAPPAAPPVAPADEKKALRRIITKKVNRYANLTSYEHRKIHYKLNQACGSTIDVATVEQLERRLQILDGWIEEWA